MSRPLEDDSDTGAFIARFARFLRDSDRRVSDFFFPHLPLRGTVVTTVREKGNSRDDCSRIAERK
jgi:hypothetical protein